MKTVGVNRAFVQIHPSGRARDSGSDTFTKKKKNQKKNKKMKSKQKELNEHLGTSSDLPIWLDWKGELHLVTDNHDVILMDHDEHTSYQEAISSPNSDRWLEAIKSEMQSMYGNQV